MAAPKLVTVTNTKTNPLAFQLSKELGGKNFPAEHVTPLVYGDKRVFTFGCRVDAESPSFDAEKHVATHARKVPKAWWDKLVEAHPMAKGFVEDGTLVVA